MSNISILVPTRKRPKNIDRLLKELQSSLDSEKIEIVLGIDIDDDSYDIESLVKKSKNIKVVRTPTTKYLSNLYNILVEYSTGGIIGYFSDDVSFINLSLIDEVIEFYKTNTKFLYSFNTDNLTTHGFVSRESIKLIGNLFPPYLEHGYCDRYMEKLYGETNRKIINNKNFYLHLRPRENSEDWDETYRIKSSERDEKGLTCDERDKIIYEDYLNKYLSIQQNILLK